MSTYKKKREAFILSVLVSCDYLPQPPITALESEKYTSQEKAGWGSNVNNLSEPTDNSESSVKVMADVVGGVVGGVNSLQ